MPTVTALTTRYIDEHRSIKDCMLRDVINYSALARLIISDLDLEGQVSNEAVLIAARRYREKLAGKVGEDPLVGMLTRSNVEIKNNIVIYTLGKNIYPESLLEAEKLIKKEGDLFFSIEGTKTITVIVQAQSKKELEGKIRYHVLDRKDGLVLITITSPGIDAMPGAVNHVTGLFYDNDINIEEFMSCHDDTLIVVDEKHMGKLGNIFYLSRS